MRGRHSIWQHMILKGSIYTQQSYYKILVFTVQRHRLHIPTSIQNVLYYGDRYPDNLRGHLCLAWIMFKFDILLCHAIGIPTGVIVRIHPSALGIWHNTFSPNLSLCYPGYVAPYTCLYIYLCKSVSLLYVYGIYMEEMQNIVMLSFYKRTCESKLLINQFRNMQLLFKR